MNLFLLVEAFWAKEPIFPLRLLLNRDVITTYINLGFQTGAQGAVSHMFISSERVGTDQEQMMMLVPIYFQVSAHASLTNAGAHLMPSVIGNAIGGLLVGYIINKSAPRFHILSSQLTLTEPANTNPSPLSAVSPRSRPTLL